MSVIIENTILFSAVECGTKDPIDKLTCDKSKSWLPIGMTTGSANFTMLFQIEEGPTCIVFSLFPKRSIAYPA